MPGTASRPRSSPTRSGCTSGSPSATATWRNSWPRGVILTYETIRQWCRKFGQRYANELRRRRPRPGDKWHLDEVFITINGATHYLWRAVDQDGTVLDILV